MINLILVLKDKLKMKIGYKHVEYLNKITAAAAAAAKSLQSCPTLCDPIDGSHQAPPSLGSHRGVALQARTLE